MNYTHLFWDWNGTLLDDADYCIAAVNRSLSARGLPLMDRKRYYEVFRFPIREYYVDLGFDFTKEKYEDLAEEYNLAYASEIDKMPLRRHAKEVLAVFRGKSLPQYILSASERNVLLSSLRLHGIEGYFSSLVCTDNYLADGKIAYGKRFAETLPAGSKLLLVGDTEHDYETARAIGADCVLLSGGHSSAEKLASFGVPVIDDLYELYPIVFGSDAKRAPLPSFSNADAAERRSFDINEAEKKDFRTKYKDFYDDLKNTNKTEDW